MKISELQEMTMRVGSLDNQLKKFSIDPNIQYWKTSSHAGDIEDKKVLLYKASETNWVYSLWKEEEFVGYILLIKNDPVTVEQTWIAPDFRGQQVFSKLLWFLKTRAGYSSILLGDVHSRDTVEVLKYLSRFKKYWTNGRDKIPYDPDSIHQFYSLEKPTDWKLLLENDGDFSSWPKYRNKSMYLITDIYDWQIE